MRCENCTHIAVGAVPKSHSIQQSIGGARNTHEMSGYGLHYGLNHGFWDSKGISEDGITIKFNL